MASGRTVWQIAAGDKSRDYGQVFLDYGVALIGPGNPGPWTPRHPEYKGQPVERFARDVQEADIFVLRRGTSFVAAVGLVASEYEHRAEFADVNGWDLQHTRRVRWLELPEPHNFKRPVFGANPRCFSRTFDREVIDLAAAVVNSPPDAWKSATLPDLPAGDPPLHLNELSPDLRQVVGEIMDLSAIYSDPETIGARPKEDEIVAHCLVPLLRSLGWLSHQIAIKWNDIDVTLFRGLPRSQASCCMLIEAKRRGLGIEGALKQACGYAQRHNLTCNLLVTDGILYKLFSGRQERRLIASANLSSLRRSALDLFEQLRWRKEY